MIEIRFGRAILLMGFITLTQRAFGEETPEQLMALVRDGNRSAIQSIQTMECRFERIPWAGTSQEKAQEHFFMWSGRYWRSGDVYRYFESHDLYDEIDVESVFRNGRLLIRGKSSNPGISFRPTLSICTPVPVDGTGGTMWQFLLFSHWGWQKASYYTLEEILQHKPVVHSVERLSSPSGQICVKLSHRGASRQDFWLDPKVNYLVRKCIWVPAEDADLRWEHEVIEFVEPAPSVFIPSVIEVRCFRKGKQEAVIRTLITELKVNHAMPKSSLRIPGIAGMDCLDLDREVKYKVDADGNAVGPEQKAPVMHLTPEESKNPPVRNRGNASPLPSQPPTAGWFWVFLAALAVVVAGLWLRFNRRRHAERN